MKAAIIRIRGDDGEIHDIPALIGPPGPAGPPGADGKSAFEAAVEGGYTGTEDEFNAKLKMLAELDIYDGEVEIPEDDENTDTGGGDTGGDSGEDSGGDNTPPDTGGDDNTGGDSGEDSGDVIHVTNVSLNKISADLKVGDTLQLVHTVEPDNATNKNVNYKSYNEDIASVTETGLVTALAEGQALIVCVPEDNAQSFGSTCVVNVAAASSGGDSGSGDDNTGSEEETPDTGGDTEGDGTVHVTSVQVDPGTAIMKVGETLQLTPVIKPENATNKAVTYNSYYPNLASVTEAGLVTALAQGQALIGCTPVDNEKCETNGACLIEIMPADDEGGEDTGDGSSVRLKFYYSSNSGASYAGYPYFSYSLDNGASFIDCTSEDLTLTDVSQIIVRYNGVGTLSGGFINMSDEIVFGRNYTITEDSVFYIYLTMPD